ncbi:hypothetical protein AJ87_12310 [Rhizobium yanglingense]|nr:hypothetical protein AJ87_12310 [Rhizobium yanglingense]
MPNLLKAARDAREGRAIACEQTSIDALLHAAADESLEPAFRAQALALPSESDISRELGSNNDPDAIHAGRQAVMKQIADRGIAIFTGLFEKMTTPGDFSPDAKSAGRRALRNAALTYLSYVENGPARAKAAFDAANNMTERLHALTVLAHRFPESGEAIAALSTFRDHFAENALVIDKWFSVQATIPGPRALDRVRKLMEIRSSIAPIRTAFARLSARLPSPIPPASAGPMAKAIASWRARSSISTSVIRSLLPAS